MSESTSTLSPSSSGSEKSVLKLTLLTGLFFFLLTIFTISKLPTSKITALIQGNLQVFLDPFGIYVTDQGRDFSIIRGFRYHLTKPTFELPDQTRIEFEELSASPRILSLFKGMAGANLNLKQKVNNTISEIDVAVAGRSDKVQAHIQLDQVDLAKVGILAFAGQIKGTGTVSGTMDIEGSLSDPSTLTGAIQLTLKNIQLDEQNIMGFQLDTMKIAEGLIDIQIQQGKLEFKNVRIGKPGGSDDLNALVTGNLALNRNLNASNLNLKVVLGLSDRAKQKLSLIDSLLGSAKQSDGRYAYKLTGSLGAPFPQPDPGK